MNNAEVKIRLDKASQSLMSLSCLIFNVHPFSSLSDEQFYGIGSILEGISKEISDIQEKLSESHKLSC